MKQMIGCFLIALPFLCFLYVAVKDVGVKPTVCLLLILLGVVTSVYTGAYLIRFG